MALWTMVTRLFEGWTGVSPKKTVQDVPTAPKVLPKTLEDVPKKEVPTASVVLVEPTYTPEERMALVTPLKEGTDRETVWYLLSGQTKFENVPVLPEETVELPEVTMSWEDLPILPGEVLPRPEELLPLPSLTRTPPLSFEGDVPSFESLAAQVFYDGPDMSVSDLGSVHEEGDVPVGPEDVPVGPEDFPAVSDDLFARLPFFSDGEDILPGGEDFVPEGEWSLPEEPVALPTHDVASFEGLPEGDALLPLDFPDSDLLLSDDPFGLGPILDPMEGSIFPEGQVIPPTMDIPARPAPMSRSDDFYDAETLTAYSAEGEEDLPEKRLRDFEEEDVPKKRTVRQYDLRPRKYVRYV